MLLSIAFDAELDARLFALELLSYSLAWACFARAGNDERRIAAATKVSQLLGA